MSKEPYQREDGKWMVLNTCGHERAYNIKKPGAQKWLQGRPCPSCARKNPNKGLPNPMPEKKNEPPKLKDIETGVKPDVMPEEPKVEVKDVPQEDILRMFKTFPQIPEDVLTHKILPDLLLLTQTGAPVWLQGPPGTAKSTLAQQVSEILGLGFYPVSCHEMMTRTDLFGYRDAAGNEHRTPLWDAYELGGVCLLDEVDNGNPNLLAALNSALSNGHCVFGSGKIVAKHDDFRVIATANTAGLGPESGFVGRLGVDLATRDRFVSLAVDIDADLEMALASLYAGDLESVEKDKKRCHARMIEHMMSRAKNACEAETPEALYLKVSQVRREVESRYKGTVVSPRTTIHTVLMSRKGFTFRECVTAKLAGFTSEDVTDVMRGV